MHRQRGAISIIAAATLVVAVLAVALALDIGRIMVERQRLQVAADAAALAGARALAIAGDPDDVPAAVQASAQENGYTASLDAGIEVGHLLYQDGLRNFTAGAPYNAVRVVTTRTVPRSLVAGALLPGDVLLTARAAAYRESIAAVKAGSGLVALDTQGSAVLNAVLGGLLGTNLSLDAVSYNNLLGANVALADLLVRTGVGSVEELLALDMGLGDFLELTAEVLQADGSVAAVTLNNVAHTVDERLHIRLGELLNVSANPAALQAGINVLDLLTVSAQLANQGRAVDVDLKPLGSVLSSLGLADLDLRLGITQAPQIAVGPPGRDPATGDWHTKARTGQVDLQVSLQTLELNLLGLLHTAIDLDLFIQAASAEAWVETIEPAAPSSPTTRVRVGAATELARIGIGRPAGATINPSRLLKVKVPLLIDLEVNAKADLPVGAEQTDALDFAGPFVPVLDSPVPANTQLVGTNLEAALLQSVGGLLSGAEIDVELDLLGVIPIGISVGDVTRSLANILNPLLDSLAVNLLTPLLSQLGLQIGGADVTVLHASAGQVRLVQ